MPKKAATLEEGLKGCLQNFIISENGCWLWLGKANVGTGYGRVNLCGKIVLAHRVFYEQYVSPIKPGEEIHHKCENRICVRPSHLVAVTRKVHVSKSNCPPGLNIRKTHCPSGHPYDRVDSKGWRRCSVCDHGRPEYYRDYYQRVRKPKDKEKRNAYSA